MPDRDKQTSTFAFDAESWITCVGQPIILHKVFRQKDQGEQTSACRARPEAQLYICAAFVDMLNSMRLGQLTPETVDVFMRLSRKVTYEDGIDPTDL